MEQQGGTKKKEESKLPTEAIEALPLESKLKILSFLDLKTQEEVLETTTKHEALPPITFMDKLNRKVKLRKFTEEELKALENDGYIVKDNFFGSEHVPQLRKEVEKMLEEGKLKPAAMGRGEDSWADTKIRGDLIMWLNNEKRWALKETHPLTFQLLDKVDSFRRELNQACDFDSQHTQVQLACYPGNGTRYVRHLDAYVGGSTRRITAIYYLNPNWKPEDGGQLRLFLKDGTTKDVEPIADRLLIFQSRRLWHEVLASNAQRFALTTWFY